MLLSRRFRSTSWGNEINTGPPGPLSGTRTGWFSRRVEFAAAAVHDRARQRKGPHAVIRGSRIVAAAHDLPVRGRMNPGRVSLQLLGGFELRLAGAVVTLPLSAQRLIAFLALHERALQRLFVAGSLWLDSTDERANANLRTALWRLRRLDGRVITATATQVALAPGVRMDVREAQACAQRALCSDTDDRDLADLCRSRELLPDWYDEWVVNEREGFRQLRLHALERTSERLVATRRYGEALQAALTAVAEDPLRESAQRALIHAYLAEGNQADALRQYRSYKGRLADELGLRPSPLMRDLVAALPVPASSRS